LRDKKYSFFGRRPIIITFKRKRKEKNQDIKKIPDVQRPQTGLDIVDQSYPPHLLAALSSTNPI
jgi:hypothetical protein